MGQFKEIEVTVYAQIQIKNSEQYINAQLTHPCPQRRKQAQPKQPPCSLRTLLKNLPKKLLESHGMASIGKIISDDSPPCRFLKLIFVIQNTQTLKLQRSTRYLIKLYIDQVIHQHPTLPLEDILKLAITCILLGIQFNEDREFSEKIFVPTLYMTAGFAISEDQAGKLIESVLTSLSFKLRYTTPYDYYPIFNHCLPWFRKIGTALDKMLGLALLHPQSCQHTPEQLFYGAVLALFDYKQVQLSDLQVTILHSCTDSWVGCQAVKAFILEMLPPLS